ncbi:MAG: GNAT family N-acetyltransferase [Anaerolineales bacterium]|nr:GNAT family N-acetyltransferase [Anaerolineales bacterium]
MGVSFLEDFNSMVALQQSLTATSTNKHLRPIDARRDLNQIADLIEMCFSSTIDPDGESYIRQMRKAAKNTPYMQWIGSLGEQAPFPTSGFVWEDEGRIIGNLTLIPVLHHTHPLYLIANVAVHPDYRRRGIARQLTQAALTHARQRKAHAIWLHVREENLGAYQLYRSLGFVERARRTTWYYSKDIIKPADELSNRLRSFTRPAVTWREHRDWSAQQKWLENTYPSELRWHLTLRTNLMNPGFFASLYRFFIDARIQHWCARFRDQLWGIITWQPTTNYADHLWLAVHPDNEEIAAFTLLSHIVERYKYRRPLSLDYPAGRASNAIQSAGFQLHQTLVWMKIE